MTLNGHLTQRERWVFTMASYGATAFENNAFTPGMVAALMAANTAGNNRQPFTSDFFIGLHQTLTGHNLGGGWAALRASEVRLGPFKEYHIPQPEQLRSMLFSFEKDINWLLACCIDDAFTVTARAMMRSVAMQFFQDGNKRASFAMAAYILAYRGMDGVLVPRSRDSRGFVRAAFHGDERAVIKLVKRWYTPL